MTEQRRPQEPLSTRARLALYAGTFCVAGTVLLLEVALTRVFAILMWHHFAYMVVSLALVGFGASGSILAVRGARSGGRDVHRRLALWSSLYGLAVILAFLVATRIRVESLEIWKEPLNFLGLFAIFAVLAIPFLLAGMAIGTAISCFTERVGRVYASDLIGSAAGAACAPWLLASVGPAATVIVAAATALAGAFLFSAATSRARAAIHGSLAALGILLAVGFAGGGGFVPAIEWEIPFAPQKGVGALMPGLKREKTIHSSVAQVDVSTPIESPMFIGGQFGDKGIATVVIRGVVQDGTAPTAMYENAADYKRFDALDDTQAASAYLCFRALGRERPRVLVIGVGGGPDVMVALYHDAEEVKAVEINNAMIEMVTEEYADFLGHLFDDPRVELIQEDGRAYARRERSSFDIIQMSGVDTYTALSTGAYTLSESYLYTVEAIKDFYSRLRPGGYINYSRFLLKAPKRPRETIRLVNIARQALEELGVAEPWRHIVVLQAHGWASTMIKESPFTRTEVEALRRFADEENFMGLVADPFRPRGRDYYPGEWPDGSYSRAAARALKQAGSDLGLDAEGPTPPELVGPMVEALRAATAGRRGESDRHIQSLVEAVVPKALRARVTATLKEARDTFASEYRAASEHFVRVQKDFETLLRSDAAGRRDFVNRYFYDLSPSTDDKPFFFSYYRFDRLLDTTGKESWDEAYHPDFPVGHMVLLSSMFQIVLLGGLLIFWPLMGKKLQGATGSEKLRVFTYFAGLGIGFMFVEICLMQRFVLFLGHPAYSLCVVLAAILLFSGLGAMFTARIRKTDARLRGRLVLLVCGTIIATILAVSFVLDALMGMPFPLRVLATVLLCAPVGFVMGMPFPLGIRILGEHAPSLVPWAWAINGFLSVFSGLAAIVLAMAGGFTAVLVTGAVIYAVGLYQLPFLKRLLRPA